MKKRPKDFEKISVNFVDIPKQRQAFFFQIMRKGKGKNRMKNISIPHNSTFSDLDKAVRIAYSYDSWDHCSAFYNGTAYRGKKVAQLSPDGSGVNESRKVKNIFSTPGTSLTYVYDFGDDIRHDLTYVGIVESEPNTIEIYQ